MAMHLAAASIRYRSWKTGLIDFLDVFKNKKTIKNGEIASFRVVLSYLLGSVTELANVPDLKSVSPKGHVGSRPTAVVCSM